MQGLVRPILGNVQGKFGRVCAAEKEQSLDVTYLSFIGLTTEKDACVRERFYTSAGETFAGYLIVCIENQGSAQLRGINSMK